MFADTVPVLSIYTFIYVMCVSNKTVPGIQVLPVLVCGRLLPCTNVTAEVTAAMSEARSDVTHTGSCIYYSKIRGYHIYQEIWTATVGEILECCREAGNLIDPYAVAVVRGTGTCR